MEQVLTAKRQVYLCLDACCIIQCSSRLGLPMPIYLLHSYLLQTLMRVSPHKCLHSRTLPSQATQIRSVSATVWLPMHCQREVLDIHNKFIPYRVLRPCSRSISRRRVGGGAPRSTLIIVLNFPLRTQIQFQSIRPNNKKPRALTFSSSEFAAATSASRSMEIWKA